jgi:hypothetical protein
MSREGEARLAHGELDQLARKMFRGTINAKRFK